VKQQESYFAFSVSSLLDSFFAAKQQVCCGLHNLVVPLSFRCIYSFISPPCYLSGGALTRSASLKAV